MVTHSLFPALNFKLLKGGTAPHLNKWVLIYPGKDGNWIAECPSLPGCISQGRTKKKTIEHIEEAVVAYLAVLKEDGLPIPKKGKRRIKSALATTLKISARTCVNALGKKGFYFKKIAGSEFVSGSMILRRDDPFTQLVIPICRRLDSEALMLIIKLSGLTLREFTKLLYEAGD